MSHNLESIIRPFQNNQVSPSQTYFEAGEAPPENVVLEIGKSGSGKVLTASNSATVSTYMTKYETERKTPLGGAHHSDFVGQFGQGVIGAPMGG
jgi:hypothetical protein